MMTKRSVSSLRLTIALIAAAGALAPALVQAQTFPSKNVQMIIPYTAGGSIDTFGRAVAQRLTEAWGRNVVVDNRPGASGMIGTEMVTKMEADGHVLLAHTSSYPATASVRAKLPFDPARAIVPVAMIARAPMLVAIHPSVPAKNIKELVALARKHKTGFNYGSSGTGGNNHFSGALFAAAADIKMTHVPYKGIAQAVTALASGEVEIVISSQAALLPQMKANRVRILAVTSPEPSPLFPNIPTVVQAGVPADRLATINAAVNKILSSDGMKKFIAAEGAEPWPLTPQQLDGMLVKEIDRYKKAAQVAGIQPQ